MKKTWRGRALMCGALLAAAGCVLLWNEADMDIQKPTALPDYMSPQAGEAVLSFTGDVMLGSYLHSGRMHPEAFTAAAPFLSVDQLSLVNLEGPIWTGADLPAGSKHCSSESRHCHAFAQSQSVPSFLKSQSVEAVGIVNNHSWDLGTEGLAFTQRALAKEGLPVLPFSKPSELVPGGEFFRAKLNGVSVSILSLATTSGLPNFLDDRYLDMVQKEALTSLVVVYAHAGCEGAAHARIQNKQEACFGENRGNVYAQAQKLAASGAKLVVLHGPHVPRAMERTAKGALIAYSLGNFATAKGISVQGEAGLAPLLQVKVSPRGVAECRVVSFTQSRAAGLVHDTSAAAGRRIKELSIEAFGSMPCLIN